jgi:hypothetical protein
MAVNDVLTYQEDGRWLVVIEGDSRPTSSHDTRDEAIDVGRELAMIRECEHIVVDYVPRGAGVQTDLGAVNGGQASLY